MAPSSTATKPKKGKGPAAETSSGSTRSGGARVKKGEVLRGKSKPEKKGKKKDAGKKGKGKDKKRKAKAKQEKRVFTAKGADKYELYQLSVQSPDEDVKFLTRVYKTFRKKEAQHFREDFCGTGLLMSHWIKRGERFTAEGFDIDPEPVAWGKKKSFEPLGADAERAVFHLKDVREPSKKRPDVRSAQNFSYFVFKERSVLLDYCRKACQDLAPDGVFVMDIYGGPEAMEEMIEEREIEEGFTYVWDQDQYWPATGDYRAYIHFEFEDGTKLKKAFRYDWRLWTLPEVRDVLLDAGFSSVVQYWEGTDEDGESGNGIYRRSAKGENCLAWVTYLVALK